jgi:hypothetical protein
LRPIEAAWLGALLGGEGYFRYRNAKSAVTTSSRKYVYHYWRFRIELGMGEEEWVREAARLCGVSYRRTKRKYWVMTVEGSCAVAVVKAIRPYLYGCKAAAADIVRS